MKISGAESQRRYRLGHPEKYKEGQRKWREANREKMAAYRKKWREKNIEKAKSQDKEWRKKNPARSAYLSQKSRAKERGVEFLLTFEEWWEMWEPHWERRGRSLDDMQMCRTGDTGPYSVENCRIDTCRNNKREYYGNAKLGEDHVRDIRKRHGKGEKQAALAREYCLSRAGVHSIIHRRTWNAAV